jgi:uroporphyrinogen III methyltransferase / synthase
VLKSGKVYIIGAGPGDPGLITVKGARCIGAADVVVYDHLVGEELLAYARPEAQRIYAGKQGGDHTLAQWQINALLVAEAGQGKTVARLKGGDPFIFGRGGEEAEVLAEAGIPFEVVPGVTAAIAVPAYAGIPLTHRAHTATVAFVTGHEDPTKEASGIDWASVAGMGTIVLLMGVKNLPQITTALLRHGRAPETPVALIRWGTTAKQETLTATLGDIAARAQAENFRPPAILVVGAVVNLRERLAWFERKPLFGKGILITRPEAQAGELARLLAGEGALPVLFPTIAIAPPENWRELDEALARLREYAWLVFTSANGVAFFFGRLAARGRSVDELEGARVCTIGPATAAAVAAQGLRVDLVPEEFVSEGIVRAFAGLDMAGKRVLLPRAAEARDVIPAGLMALGAQVDTVVVYRTIGSGRSREELEAALRQDNVEVITFTSPSTVKHYLAISEGAVPEKVRIACIGPVTAAAARRAGLPVHIVQEEYTIPGLVAEIVRHFEGESER